MRTITELNTTPPPTPSSSSLPTINNGLLYSPQRSPWHSPVPYLFGGLAAMLGLIAFSLLLLACSYWRLSSRQLEDGEDDDIEKKTECYEKGLNKVYEEKFLVIMAGDNKPSFLATPSTVVVCNCNSFNGEKIETKSEENDCEGGKTETRGIYGGGDDDEPPPPTVSSQGTEPVRAGII